MAQLSSHCPPSNEKYAGGTDVELLSEEAKSYIDPRCPKWLPKKLEFSRGYPWPSEVGSQLVCDPWLLHAKSLNEIDLPLRHTRLPSRQGLGATGPQQQTAQP